MSRGGVPGQADGVPWEQDKERQIQSILTNRNDFYELGSIEISKISNGYRIQLLQEKYDKYAKRKASIQCTMVVFPNFTIISHFHPC